MAELLIVVTLVLIATIAIIGIRRARRQCAREPAQLLAHDPMEGAYGLLFERLCNALPGYQVFPHVCLERFVRVQGSNRDTRAEQRAALRGHAVDFLLRDAESALIAAVELEDMVRGERGGAQRDVLLRAAAIPVLRWSTLRLPDEAQIRQALNELETLRELKQAPEAVATDEYAGERREPYL